MDACDVLIVGGGPAGSSCAWGLRSAGLDVVILDRKTFPRDKICGGWVTPQVIAALQIELTDYARGRTLQPITKFRTGWIGGPALETKCGQVVSYGIRRSEFDEYLLRRSGARLMEGVSVSGLERDSDGWIVNGSIRTRLLIGAGGHFCPVAKLTGSKPAREHAVVAQESEFEMDEQQQTRCQVSAEQPELYFCADLKGYGWCFRKQNFLNIGLGRMDPHRLSEHVAGFRRFLQSTGRISFALPESMPGHAYLLYGVSKRKVADDRLLLIGDAAGLAYKQSGEGIRPAVESALLAAQTIRGAEGDYSRRSLGVYEKLLASRFGNAGKDWASRSAEFLPYSWISAAGRRLLSTRWFVQNVVIDRWFLHSDEPAL